MQNEMKTETIVTGKDKWERTGHAYRSKRSGGHLTEARKNPNGEDEWRRWTSSSSCVFSTMFHLLCSAHRVRNAHEWCSVAFESLRSVPRPRATSMPRKFLLRCTTTISKSIAADRSDRSFAWSNNVHRRHRWISNFPKREKNVRLGQKFVTDRFTRWRIAATIFQIVEISSPLNPTTLNACFTCWYSFLSSIFGTLQHLPWLM